MNVKLLKKEETRMITDTFGNLSPAIISPVPKEDAIPVDA